MVARKSRSRFDFDRVCGIPRSPARSFFAPRFRLSAITLPLAVVLALAAMLPRFAVANPQDSSPSFDQVLNRIVTGLAASVVQVQAFRPVGPSLPAADGVARYSLEPSRSTYWATGVVIDDQGSVLTCAEAVQPGDSLEARLADGSLVGATFVAQDADLGISMIRLAPPVRVEAIEQAPMPAPGRGDWLLVCNYPAEDFKPGIRLATLRGAGVDATGTMTYLHFSLPDCRGTCGGVVVDGLGRFRGMVVDVRTECETERLGAASLVGDQYECSEVRALCAQRLLALAGELKTRGLRPSGFLGVSAAVGDVADAAAATTAGSSGPLFVVQVFPGSPAEVAGILPGDQLLEIGDRPLNGLSQITDRITALKPGTDVQIKLLRKGAPLTLHARLVDRSALRWIEREKQMDLVRQKRLRQSIRTLESRLQDLDQRISRYH